VPISISTIYNEGLVIRTISILNKKDDTFQMNSE
jgi:hypothetical protein